MARTERTRWDGTPIRDGEWGRRCPDSHCNICGTGTEKRKQRRKWRNRGKAEIKVQRGDA